MAIDLTPPPPELPKLDEQIAHCRKRLARATEKVTIAQTEFREAVEASAAATSRREAWLKANPPAQGDLLSIVPSQETLP